ncbi:MAG: FkbM family methyltransferase [Pseudomonadota bacterium]
MAERTESDGEFGAHAPDQAIRTLIRLSQMTPLGRGKLRRRVADMVRAGHNGPLDISLFGLNARLSLRHNGSETKALLKPSLYSRTAASLFAEILPTQNSVVVDIGANAGVFSLLAASKMRSGHLIAVEPQEVLFKRLSDHLGCLNPALGDQIQVTLFNCAVGAEEGSETLSVPRQLGQASLHSLPDSKAVRVEVRPLHELVAASSIQHIDILKIDIEGFEDVALIPFFASTPEAMWPRAILLEHCHSDRWKVDFEAHLNGLGYRSISKGRTDVALVRQNK